MYKLLEENINDIKFIPYGLDNMTQNNTMREIIIQQNTFLDTVKIVPVFGITDNDKEQVQDILGQSKFFTGMEPTRKSASEGKYLLVTTQSNLYCAQQEADTLLGKFYKKGKHTKIKLTLQDDAKNHWFTIIF